MIFEPSTRHINVCLIKKLEHEKCVSFQTSLSYYMITFEMIVIFVSAKWTIFYYQYGICKFNLSFNTIYNNQIVSLFTAKCCLCFSAIYVRASFCLCFSEQQFWKYSFKLFIFLFSSKRKYLKHIYSTCIE